MSQIPRPVKISNARGYPYAPGHDLDLDRIRPLLDRRPGPHHQRGQHLIWLRLSRAAMQDAADPEDLTAAIRVLRSLLKALEP